MAALFKTVRENLNVFGPIPTNKYNSTLFGQKWAYTNRDLVENVFKHLTEIFTISEMVFSVGIFARTSQDTINFSDRLSNVRLRDANGYYYDDGGTNSYTQISGNGSIWTELDEPSTVWS